MQAAESPAARALSGLQRQANAAPVQFGRWGFLKGKREKAKLKKKEKRSAKAGGQEQLLLGDGEDYDDDTEEFGNPLYEGVALESSEDDDEDLGILVSDDMFDDGLEEVLADDKKYGGGLYKWQRDARGDSHKAALIATIKRYNKHVRTVLPAEFGEDDFEALEHKLNEELSALPAPPDEEITERSGLLANAEGIGENPLARDDLETLDDDRDDDPESEDVDRNRARLRKIIAKVRGALGRLPEDHQRVAMVALAMANAELDGLIQTHKSWRSTLMAMGAGGPAGYLEEKILPVVLKHMATHLKEFVPKGKGRNVRGKLADFGEGLLDVGWNTASLAVEGLSLGAASAGTSAIGASYKMGFAGASAKRAGSGNDKAAAQAIVTFVLEFLQGLIPFVGSGLGVASGFRGMYKTVNPRKLAKTQRGYSTLRDADDEPDPIAMLEPRIDRGDELLARSREVRLSSDMVEHVRQLEEHLAWMRSQVKKIGKRQKGGRHGWPADTASQSDSGFFDETFGEETL